MINKNEGDWIIKTWIMYSKESNNPNKIPIKVKNELERIIETIQIIVDG